MPVDYDVDDELWVATFDPYEYPHVLTALELSGLTDGRTFPGAWDYTVHAPNSAEIQLYTDKPREAKWIPILEALFNQTEVTCNRSE